MHLGLRVVASAVLALSAATAPYQCARKVTRETKMEDEADEVLYKLAERFKAAGDVRGQAGTLRYLIERYPSSRYAGMAKQDLEQLGSASSGGSQP